MQRLFTSILIALLASLFASCPSQAQIPPVERQALIDLYEATDGDNWHYRQSFQSTTLWLDAPGTECEWWGVRCSDEPDPDSGLHAVTGLFLPGNRLSGELPPGLQHLTSLEGLNLGSNQLTGEIPGFLLSRPLRTLDLAFNQFTSFGQAPPGMPRPSTFTNVWLDHNPLGEFPPKPWTDSPSLISLDLSATQLSGSLALDRPFPSLKYLNLAENSLDLVAGVDRLNFPALETLDLSRNRLQAWPALTSELDALTGLDLSHNELGPSWPEGAGGLLQLERLKLNANGLTGPLPVWFGSLSLNVLDLADNDINGDISVVLAALSESGESGALSLSARNNRLSGALPADFPWERFKSGQIRFRNGHALDLCNNPLEIPEGMDEAPINAVHRGENLRDCLEIARQPIDPTISGSWFYPPTAGEGFSVMLLEGGQLLVYWFTYPVDGFSGIRHWWVGQSEALNGSAHITPMLATQGLFGRGGSVLNLRGSFETGRFSALPRLILDQNEENNIDLTLEREVVEICSLICPPPNISERVSLRRLTRLAGSTCDNQHPRQGISGAWMNAEASGEGFIVEVNEDGRGLVYWFTYLPFNAFGRTQVWMIGQGDFDGSTLHISELIQPRGGQNWSRRNPERVVLDPWGELTMRFDDELNGEVSFSALDSRYGSGAFPISRLARPMLAECD